MNEVLQLQPRLSEWKNSGFQLVLVTSDSKETMQNFMDKNNVDAVVLMDTDGTISTQYGIQYIPADFLINSDGTLHEDFVGWSSDRLADMEQWVKGK